MPPPPRKVFGQTVQKSTQGRGGGGPTRYQRQFGRGNQGSSNSGRRVGNAGADGGTAASTFSSSSAEAAVAARLRGENLDESFGIDRFCLTNVSSSERNGPENPKRRGWLYNVLSTTVRSFGGVNRSQHIHLCH